MYCSNLKVLKVNRYYSHSLYRSGMIVALLGCFGYLLSWDYSKKPAETAVLWKPTWNQTIHFQGDTLPGMASQWCWLFEGSLTPFYLGIFTVFMISMVADFPRSRPLKRLRHIVISGMFYPLIITSSGFHWRLIATSSTFYSLIIISSGFHSRGWELHSFVEERSARELKHIF